MERSGVRSTLGQHKNDALSSLLTFVKNITLPNNIRVQRLGCDKGIEFRAHYFRDYLQGHRHHSRNFEHQHASTSWSIRTRRWDENKHDETPTNRYRTTRFPVGRTRRKVSLFGQPLATFRYSTETRCTSGCSEKTLTCLHPERLMRGQLYTRKRTRKKSTSKLFRGTARRIRKGQQQLLSDLERPQAHRD